MGVNDLNSYQYEQLYVQNWVKSNSPTWARDFCSSSWETLQLMLTLSNYTTLDYKNY